MNDGKFVAYKSWTIMRGDAPVATYYRKGIARNAMQRDLGDKLVETVSLCNVPVKTKLIDAITGDFCYGGTSEIETAPLPKRAKKAKVKRAR